MINIRKDISPLILAGGKSSRMNYNHKALLAYDHRVFLEKLIDTFYKFDYIYYSINSNQDFNFEKGIKLIDTFYNLGPISGVFQGLTQCKGNYIFVIPCDCPNISSELIDYICNYVSSDFDAFIIKDRNGFIHPLIGVYNKNILPVVTKMINNNNFKIKDILNKIKVKYIDLSLSKFEDYLIKNINTKEEYSEFLNFGNKIIPFIAISGIKNSGKTTLICNLLNKFKNLGYKVATIKHDGHNFNMDNLNSDTDKHIKNGALGTLIFSNNQLMFLEKINEISLEKYFSYFKDYDFVLLEGFKNSHYPKIEIIRNSISNEPFSKDNIIFYATDCEHILKNKDFKSIDLKDTDKIFKEILKYFTRRI